MEPSAIVEQCPKVEELRPIWRHQNHFDKDSSCQNNDDSVSIWEMNKALENTLKTIEFNTRMIKTTTNEIIIRRNSVSEPSNNDSLFTPICANRIATSGAINNRGKSRSKVKIIHNSKRLHYASKDGTFERENYYVSPADSLNGWDAARLRPPWLHFVWDIPAKPVDTKAHRRREYLLGLSKSKDSSTERAGHYFSSLSLLLSTRFH